MREYIRIAFHDATFQMPTMVIVAHRAETLSRLAPSEYASLDDALVGTAKLFGDEQEIINWAANNMTWDDLRGQSMMLSCASPERSLKQSLAHREWEFSDEPCMPEQLVGHADDTPLGLMVSHLVAQGGSCNFMTIGDPPTYAVALMVGTTEEIGGYATGMQALAGMVARKRDGKPDIQEPGRIIVLPH